MTTIFTDPLANQTGGFAGLSIRNELPVTGGSLGQVRVTFTATSGAVLICDHCAIGVSTNNGTGSTVAVPVELKFSGASGFSIAAGASITSDWANLAFTSSDKLIVIEDTNASSGGVTYDTINACYTNSGASYSTQTVSGFTTNAFFLCVAQIETQAGASSVVAGFDYIQDDIYPKRAQGLSAAPAFVSIFKAAAIAGVPWSGPRDHARPRPDVAYSAPPALARPITTTPVSVSGVAWDVLKENDRLPRGRFLTEPAGPGYVPPNVTWSFLAGDTVFLRDAPIDAAPGFARPTFAAPVGISGMAWFAPPDRDRPAAKVRLEAPAAIALTPSTLPVAISGMAWFAPAAERRRAIPALDQAAAFARQVQAAAPVGISGMAWFIPADERRAGRTGFDQVAAFGRPLPAVGIAGVAWQASQDVAAPRRAPADQWPCFVPLTVALVPVPISGMAWFAPFDQVRPRVRISVEAPAGFGRGIAPPVGISGMAWFEPAPERIMRRLPLDQYAPFIGAIGTSPVAVYISPRGVAVAAEVRLVDPAAQARAVAPASSRGI